MVYFIAAVILGLSLGVFSAYRQKTFMALVISFVPIGFILMQLAGPTVLVVGFSENGGIDAFISMFKMLPEDAQDAVILFPAFVILGRLGAWLRLTFGKPKEESSEARKKRILKSYGYDKMPEWH